MSIPVNLCYATDHLISTTSPVQKIITAEKGIALNLDNLSRDSKAQSKELYTWGQSEADDLKDGELHLSISAFPYAPQYPTDLPSSTLSMDPSLPLSLKSLMLLAIPSKFFAMQRLLSSLVAPFVPILPPRSRAWSTIRTRQTIAVWENFKTNSGSLNTKIKVRSARSRF